MKRILTSFMIVLVTGVAYFGQPTQPPNADYQFQNNLFTSRGIAQPLTDLVGVSPNVFESSLVDGYTRPTLRFSFNGGVALFNTSRLFAPDSYTMVALFKFDTISGYRRIGDFKNGSSQTGAYLLNGRYEAEPTTTTPVLSGTYFQAVLVRENNGHVRAYRDGIFRVDIPNDGGLYEISDDDVLRFAQDDLVLGGEASAGNLARLRFYDLPMTSAQVRALDRLPPPLITNQPILLESDRDGFFEIYRMNADGSSQIRLTHNDVTELEPRWSPDGKSIVYTRQETSSAPYQTWKMNADGSGETRLTNNLAQDINPRWRPDGQKIIFSRCNVSFVCDLYTMNPDGSGQAPFPLVNTSGDEGQAEYSPDGSKVVFVCGSPNLTNENICIANADGTVRLTITNTVSPVGNYEPTFSPDGIRLAFQRLSNDANTATAEIYTSNLDGSGLNRLTNNSLRDDLPEWSPDGTKILFTSLLDTIREAYTMNADGSAVSRLTVNSASDTAYSWRREIVTQTARIDGKVVTPDGRGLRNAMLTLTDSHGVQRTATTSSFGFFSFEGVTKGDTYTLRISSRLFRYATQTLQLVGDVTLPDLVGLE